MTSLNFVPLWTRFVGLEKRVFARCFGYTFSEAQIADSAVFLVAFPQASQEQRLLQVSPS